MTTLLEKPPVPRRTRPTSISGLAAFADPLGPRGRRTALVASVLGGLVLLALVGAALARLQAVGQLDPDRWTELLSSEGAQFLGEGLLTTLQAAAVAIALSVAIGAVMALGRLSHLAPLRWLAGTYVELFRALPSLLLILFAFFGLPQLLAALPAGLGLPTQVSRYAALVIGLTLYNSAVMAEIIRAGVLSLPRGQAEAAAAIGLTRGQAQRLVVLPQAVSRMLPSLIAQGVVVLKDTSYGFVIGFEELLRRGQLAGEATADVLQAYVIVAVVYVAVCLALSALARYVEGRQRRRYGRAASGGTRAA
ncbi:MAG: amino acid ABC transporter permease [Actinomycetota bacterium]|jgi:glutamate transport system permease protein|nr:amino acid ABC transporter permease [Actinomycetota bacterium]